jgi:hypothetical protein
VKENQPNHYQKNSARRVADDRNDTNLPARYARSTASSTPTIETPTGQLPQFKFSTDHGFAVRGGMQGHKHERANESSGVVQYQRRERVYVRRNGLLPDVVTRGRDDHQDYRQISKHWFPFASTALDCSVKSDHQLKLKCLFDIGDEICGIL